MPFNKTEAALGAWLDTVQADDCMRASSLTLLPPSDSTRPLLDAFSAKTSKDSAAPLVLKHTIAEGGMGVIRLAEQHDLGRTVVAKTLKPNYTSDAAEHILREAWATGALEHPNIVPVHDIRSDETGAPLIVLQRIEGLSWTQLMGDSKAVQERFGSAKLLEWNLSVLKQVMQAVRFAHSRGILHRDLKPDNVMIGSFGEVYVVDWGIALSLSNAQGSRLPRASQAMIIAGTPSYMAPEMISPQPLDERTDTYLLGAILYEILSSSPPHQATSLNALLCEIRESRPQLSEECCPLLRALCLRAMSPAPSARFQNVGEFSLALEDCLEQRESMRLAALADFQYDELCEKIAESSPHRIECYGLFGALRLAYIEALNVWPGNGDAVSRLRLAREAMVEFELRQGNPNAAQAIFVEMSSASEELRERIDSARSKQAAESKELLQLRDDSNRHLGQRTRVFLALVLGLSWTVPPLIYSWWQFSDMMLSYHGMALMTLVFGALASSLAYWARDTLGRTSLNRRLAASLLSLYPTQLLLLAGLALMDVPILSGQRLLMLLWACVAAGASATADRRFAVVAAAQGTAFLVAARWPETRFLAMGGANFLTMVVAIYIWTKGAPAEERAS